MTEEETIKRLEALQAENKEWNRQHSIVMTYQNEGIAFESKGELEYAIEAYLKAVNASESLDKMKGRATYSLDRMAILYRKLKMYEDEIRCIQFHMQYCNTDTKEYGKLLQRLGKAQELSIKTSRL